MHNRLLWETTDCDVTFITLSYDERTKTVTLPWVWNLHYMISHSTVAPQCGFSWQLIIHHAVIHHGSWITALNLVSHSNWSCISYNCDWKWITALNLVSHSNWSYIIQSYDHDWKWTTALNLKNNLRYLGEPHERSLGIVHSTAQHMKAIHEQSAVYQFTTTSHVHHRSSKSSWGDHFSGHGGKYMSATKWMLVTVNAIQTSNTWSGNYSLTHL